MRHTHNFDIELVAVRRARENCMQLNLLALAEVSLYYLGLPLQQL